MPPISPAIILLLLAAALIGGGVLLVHASGSQVGLGRRLAGARQVRVGDLPDLDPLPGRPVRVAGRIRCPDPILADDDERLVALHRDIEVRLADGRWRAIERLRESRGFELYDHDWSVPLDISLAAEPLVAIPRVWRGEAGELSDEAHRAAVDRLRQEGRRPGAARSVTRTISVVDRLLILARPVRAADGGVTLAPPPGGFVVAALELPDAMRLLGGPRRGWLLAGAAAIGMGLVLVVAALALLLFG